MELYLQFGYNMQKLCEELLPSWGGGTVILSPRCSDEAGLLGYAARVQARGGNVLIDPQMFFLDANHSTLVEHNYWHSNLDADLADVLAQLQRINATAGARDYLLPGTCLDPIALRDWLAGQAGVVDASQTIMADRPRVATICLGREAVRTAHVTETVVDEAERWEVDGYYVVAEPPANQYLVTDPLWMTNLVSLLAGLKLHGRRVILGYANQQMLAAAAANIDAVASGQYKNVRSFDASNFVVDDGQGRQVPYYYAPAAYSEYAAGFLDIAQGSRLLPRLRPVPSMSNVYSDPLFSGALPSTVQFQIGAAFRHYLIAMHEQAAGARQPTFSGTFDYLMQQLAAAESLIDDCEVDGVYAARSFRDSVNVNRAALQGLKRSRGFVLKRQW